MSKNDKTHYYASASSFAKLVREHLNAVYNFAYRLTGNKDDAADISQETFLKAWKRRGNIDPEMNIRAWLFTIAKNLVIDSARKRKTVPFSDFTDQNDRSLEEMIQSDDLSPEELLVRDSDKKALRKLVFKLPLIYRETLILKYDEGMSFKEIAEILGISPNTVKSRHQRAILRLKTALASE
ncbi:MAG TPA: RNA polymerase sigma factor [Candidatus Colwellbacteria bacterium]|nr:RNA polymerase sigma factor [Candidatus Colwellbacteria bacterium]